MILSWFRKPKIVTAVVGNEIVITMPGTNFKVAYEKSEEGGLVARSFTARNSDSDNFKITFPRFLALAWKSANAKARELGWIVQDHG